jgi:uracil-DNA glycosylase
MSGRPLEDVVHPSWVPVLDPVRAVLSDIGTFLRSESESGHAWLPAGSHILRAFAQPVDSVRVLIMGQDPYPTPGHAVGLAFAVASDVSPLPRSLANIFRELHDDVGVPVPKSGDLSPWVEQGVLLLNRVLTVRAGESGSHRGHGWEQVTEAAITGLLQREGAPLVAILWGRDAQGVSPLLLDTPIIASAHPSPLSADRGFFGSRPFSRTNELLISMGAAPIDWRL